MRILQVMECTIGGTRRHLVDLSAGLSAAGLEVHVCASDLRVPDFRADLDRLAGLGVVVHRLPMVREVSPGADSAHLMALVRLLRRVRPDVLHTHSSKAGALGRAASLTTGIGARVHSPHTFAFLFGAMFSARKRALFRGIERFLGRRTALMIAVGRGEAETIAASKVIAPDRIRVVPNGIDPAPWISARPAARSSLGLPEGVPVAALVGLLNSAKGQDLAIEALALPGCERLHLAIAGTGETRSELESQARRLGVQDRAHFLGWCNDVPGLLASSDLLVLPSRWEGLPYVALEAMAVGRPVVAARVDGARELIEEGRSGFLCEVGSAADLARALSRALSLAPAERAALGSRGRELVVGGYRLDGMIQGHQAVYRELA